MKLFGSLTFDFENNRVQPAKVWHQGLTVRKKEQVRIKEKTVIPDRSEQTLLVTCNNSDAMLIADFESRLASGVPGLITSRARVIPNIDGNFQITI